MLRVTGNTIQHGELQRPGRPRRPAQTCAQRRHRKNRRTIGPGLRQLRPDAVGAVDEQRRRLAAVELRVQVIEPEAQRARSGFGERVLRPHLVETDVLLRRLDVADRLGIAHEVATHGVPVVVERIGEQAQSGHAPRGRSVDAQLQIEIVEVAAAATHATARVAPDLAGIARIEAIRARLSLRLLRTDGDG